MEIRKGDFQYVEWDDSVKFLRIVKNRSQRKFNVHAFTTLFHKELVEQRSAVAFFVYYGFAGLFAVAIVLSVFELTENQLNWTGSILPYLGVGILAIIFSFLLARLTIKMISLVLGFAVCKFRKNVRCTRRTNCTKILTEFIEINRPDRTPFPEELEKKMA